MREVVLAAGQLDPMELRQLAAAVFGPGYRDEPLELVSLVYTNEVSLWNCRWGGAESECPMLDA